MRNLLLTTAVAVTVVVAACPAHADECDQIDGRGIPMKACFDPGNRLFLSGGAATDEGVGSLGGGILVRHYVLTEDSDVSWRFEHGIADTTIGPDGWRVAVYRGRYLRHSRSGHVVLPTNPPRKLFLHSDIGVEADVGVADGRTGDKTFRLGAVRAAVIDDVMRSTDFSRRLSFGLVARWDLVVDAHDMSAPNVSEQRVSPFTMGAAALHLESDDGLSAFDLTVEGGAIWSNGGGGFRRTLATEGSVERVVIAVNDRPISVYAAGGWDDQRGARGEVGLRFGLVGRRAAPEKLPGHGGAAAGGTSVGGASASNTPRAPSADEDP